VPAATGELTVNFLCDSTHPVSYFAPVLLHISAGTISDNEAKEYAQHLQSYSNGLTPSTVGLLSGQPFRLSSAAVSPTAITSNQNNYDLGGQGLFVRLSSDASRNVTGLLATTVVDGQTHYIWNVGAQDIVLVNQSASSSAANRFLTSTGADLTITAGKCALVQYDLTTAGWRVTLLP
jgi:hypothetical protein